MGILGNTLCPVSSTSGYLERRSVPYPLRANVVCFFLVEAIAHKLAHLMLSLFGYYAPYSVGCSIVMGLATFCRRECSDNKVRVFVIVQIPFNHFRKFSSGRK